MVFSWCFRERYKGINTKTRVIEFAEFFHYINNGKCTWQIRSSIAERFARLIWNWSGSLRLTYLESKPTNATYWFTSQQVFTSLHSRSCIDVSFYCSGLCLAILHFWFQPKLISYTFRANWKWTYGWNLVLVQKLNNCLESVMHQRSVRFGNTYYKITAVQIVMPA